MFFASALDVADHVMNNLAQAAPHATLKGYLGPGDTPLYDLSVGQASVQGVSENDLVDWANRFLRWG
ncbi:hypothetical protein EVJ50_02005 [Synechococcus sp. RSCCF101]|uniref:hypothetical protein n=1 Tax=Synechococcus sp. RSCCF101 TaxID=2511069 RepID=UPI0012452FE3|nr:hypothetical protein [Synechococcus sp. RSCCF101]QEY31206.1 hypothetical protein EVJ50_02005 [Synechococcus sp. RSCCF101]